MDSENKKIVNTITDEMVDILRFGKRSENTVATYKTYVIPFLEYCFDSLGKSPYDADEKDVRMFLSHIQEERGLDDRTINNAISSIHFLFASVLDRPWNKHKVPLLTFDEYVPFVPSKEEMEAFLLAEPNPKRKAMLVIMYAAGLRVGEVCSLRYGDIIKSAGRIHVAPSKRRKERYVEMPQKCMEAIARYAGALSPETRRSLARESWLFPKQKSCHDHIYTNYIIDHIPTIEERLGWEHRFTSHTFRRAFATHNYLDGNLTMEEIQSALGHDNISTTRLYVRKGVSLLQKKHRNSIEGMSL